MTVTRFYTPRSLNERFVRAFVADGSGLDRSRIIPANRDAPAPKGDFGTVLLTQDNSDGRVFGFDLSEGEERQISQYRTAEYSVQFFTPKIIINRPTATDFAARLCMWAESDAGLLAAEGLLKDPMGWPNGTEMRIDLPLSFSRIDGLEDDDWEERALINMVARYAVSYTDSDRRIDHATVDRVFI